MDRFIKRENILKVIIVLTIINFAVLGTILFHVFQDDHHGERRQSPEKYMKSRLDLSDEQNQSFRDLKKVYHSKLSELKNDIKVDRKSMVAELNNEIPDKDRLDSLSVEIGYKTTLLKKASYRHYLHLRDVIDSSQQQELNRMYRGIMEGEDRREYRKNRMSKERKFRNRRN